MSPEANFCPACGAKQGVWVANPKARPAAGAWPNAAISIVGLVLMLGIAALVGRLIGPVGPPVAVESGPPPSPSVSVGDEAILDQEGGHGCFVALDEKSWNAMIDAQIRNDEEELAVLMKKAKAIYLRNGTRVKVIASGLASKKVRIRNGLWEGKEGWVQTEFVRPRRAGDLQ